MVGAAAYLVSVRGKVIAIGSEDEEETEINYTQAANDDWTEAKFFEYAK